MVKPIMELLKRVRIAKWARLMFALDRKIRTMPKCSVSRMGLGFAPLARLEMKKQKVLAVTTTPSIFGLVLRVPSEPLQVS
jgi:hypothetical protein